MNRELQTVQSNPLDRETNKSTYLKVAYMMSRFPKLTETFILYEMLAMQQQGIQVEVYPLIREREEVMHPEAEQFVNVAHFQHLIKNKSLRQLWKARHNIGNFEAL